MSSGRKTASFSGAGGQEEAVEELLQAAQDDLLLNLSVNSHSITSSSSLEPDLTRCFQALRSNPSASNSIPISSPNPLSDESISKDDEMKVLGEDLAMRFAKLRGGIGSSKAIEFESRISDNRIDGNGDDKQDEEVEKVMQWAMDAARLDPSHSHDDKLDEDDEKIDDSTEEEEEEEEEEEDEEELDKIKQGSKAEEKKNNKKKWLLF